MKLDFRVTGSPILYAPLQREAFLTIMGMLGLILSMLGYQHGPNCQPGSAGRAPRTFVAGLEGVFAKIL